MQINLKEEKTEQEWQKTFDEFWLKFTPKWFEWLGWLLIIGALNYITELSDSVILQLN